MTSAQAQTILYMALGEPIGLVLKTSNASQARQRFYAERKKAADPGLDDLQFRASPFAEGDLVICKSRVQVPAKASP